jgi:LysM repeat protein
MADPATALANLKAAITGALTTPGSFTLDAAFLTAGMNDGTVTVPADFDTDLGKAFQLASTAFTVTGGAGAVGPIANGQFTVTGVQVPIIGGATTAPATLLFTTTSDGSVLVVQIASTPAMWNWNTSFPYATGYPFDQLPLTAARFYYSTATGFYPWGNAGGVAVAPGAAQTLQAQVGFPTSASPYLALFAGLVAPAGAIGISGILDLSLYGAPDFTKGTILPAGTFAAVLSTGQFTFATYLTVSRPALSLIVPQPSETDIASADYTQSPSLALSTDLLLQGAGAGAYRLQVAIASSATTSYAVSLIPLSSQLLSPASAIALVGGTGSYFDGTPVFLQQFLTSFGLTGMTMSGGLSTSSASVDQVTVQLGTPPGQNMNWQPLPAPTPEFSFAIQNFALDWTVNSPFSGATFSYLFGTTFTILPTVFKKADGSEGGLFSVEFTSDQTFVATFDGVASLAGFLTTVSAGLIPSPSSVPIDITVSDISLQLDYSAQTFAFSSGVTVDFSFLQIGGDDIFAISGGLISLSAVSASSSSGAPAAATTGGGTVWSGSMSGLVTICGLDVNVSIDYAGAGDDAGWTLAAALAEPVDVSALIAQFFPTTSSYNFPSFLLGSLTVTSLGATCFIPNASTAKNTYTVSTTFDWVFDFGDQSVGIENAAIDLVYDGTAFSGSASGTWVFTPINLALGFGYTFETDGNQTLFVTWEGFTATYISAQETVTFTLKGWSVGTLIESLVSTLFEPNFSLPAPWNLLNQIALDGLSITVSLAKDKPTTLTGSYTLSSPLDLGFVKIKGISLTRTPSTGTSPGQVMLSIDGTAPPGLESSLGNLLKPEGQSVKDMPAVPGQGNEYFKLNLLALGQHVGINGYQSFASTQAAITALAKVPATGGTQNPVVPSNSVVGQPYYNAESNWLIALHFNLLKAGDVWAVDVQLVFNDPDLYGMRLALNGGKTGVLAGFVIDILYKKITDDVGLFQIDFTFPDSIRNLNFGAVSVVLPMIGIQIYTNGDFLIDLGFPYNMDFSRSFSISAIVYGVPVLGSGGVYFGKLSNATATQVPTTQLGTFNPVIVIGIGLQLGLGYNFTKGPLSAGFALTVFGIVEGVFATYHPYQPTGGSATDLQDTNYFYLQGTVGLIGLLYGTIDFKIISASLRVNITLSVRITYESFQPILISATASVSVSVSVKIDLGLFSIHISLSFSTSVTASFVINLPGEGKAPWLGSAGQVQAFALSSPRARDGRRAVWRDGALPRQAQQHPAFRSTMRAAITPRPARLASTTVKPTLSLLVAPQFTVLAPEGATDYTAQQGAYVCQFAMDAPNPADLADNTVADLATSFSLLCASFFPWLLALLSGESPSTIDLTTELAKTVNVTTLQSNLDWLGDPANTAFTTADLLQFLSDAFIVNIVTTKPADTTSHTLFPLFDGLILTVPDPAGGTTWATITIETYATGTTAYRDTVAASLREVAASIVSAPSNPGDPQAGGAVSAPADMPPSIASFVLADVFAIIGRSLLQAGIDALANFAYPVTATDSIDGIIATLNAYGNDLDTDDISVPNATAPLATNLPLTIAGLTATIQSADTLTAIAGRYSDPDTQTARWATTQAGLIEANGDARILQSGVLLTLTIEGKAEEYTTLPGDSFNQIAAWYHISLADLAGQSSLYGQTGLLLPATTMAVPPIAYKTAANDTLAGIAATFATTASLVGFDNATVAGLFVPGHIAVARLAALPVEQIWTGITATGEIGHAAGQVARFLAYGLRLPRADGLTPCDNFLYPTNQSSYALYQLTGQQFPTPVQAASYEITLGRATTSHGIDLGFITFDGEAATSINVDLSSSYTLLNTVLQYAQGGNFLPAPIGSDLPLVTLQPRQFTASGYSLWSTSDFSTLALVTGAPANAVTATPYLWNLPQSLLNGLESQQATLAKLFDPTTQYTNILHLMPAYQPRLGTTSPNSPQTNFTDITSFAYAARVDFQIARLSPTADAATQDQTASGTTVTDAPIYQLIGPSAGDGQRLEYLLTAMAALGEDIVSGLFLLYSAGGSNQTVLTGQADPAFLAFITQTNLSTESAPPAAFAARALAMAPAAPHGIANTPHQFIKLLWEQSVVHGGGYYFYWQFLPSGTGLPAEIFDSSGTATLTLVTTLKPGLNATAGNVLPNFVNSFVTTSNIDPHNDTVVVQSQTSVADSAPLKATQTLAHLAATYGVGVTALAQANPTTGFVPQSQIPIAGILHQLTAQETAVPAQTLDNLATYYSVGALVPMTGAEIATNNPGVAVVAGATFQIPPFTYVVNASLNPGPGGDFTSLAAYYALPMAAIAVAAADTGGLFAADTTINIDTLSQDTQATQAPDNLSFLLTRDNLGTPAQLPPNPTPAQQATYAQQTLFSLYNTLSAGLAANPYFLASPYGLPFGPQDDSATPVDLATAGPMHAARVRSQTLAALATQEQYQYSQVLGFGGLNAWGVPFAKINAAPANPASGLPAAADSPYIGIGSYACVALRWQDLFGNTTITPFELVPPGYTGALNNMPNALRYTDRLIGLSAWPKTQATYIYTGVAGQPSLQLTVKLDATAYDPDGKAQAVAEQDLATYRTIYFQLNQDYKNLGVPGIDGNAVTMIVSNTLLASPDQVLTDTDAKTFRDYVAACIIFLENYVAGVTPGTAPSGTLSLAVPIAGLASQTLIPLGVALTLKRNALLVEPLIAGLPDGLAVRSTIAPQANVSTDSTASSFTVFATALETCLQTASWYLRTGAGLATVSAGNATQSEQLYAVRFGNVTGAGIYFDIGASAGYYAPLPVATSLQSGSATLDIYATGGGTTTRVTNFSSIDLNLWFESCLDAIDKFLSASYAPQAFILDRLNGIADPLTGGELGKILAAKQTLADAIGGTTTPILSSSATDDSTLAAARYTMSQQLLTTLGPAFAAGAVTVFGLTNVTGADSFGAGGPPMLYGQPAAVAADDPGIDVNQNYTLTSGTIPLAPIDGNAPRLAFNVTSKNVSAQAYVGLTLSYQITHMEFDRTTVPGIDDYVQTQWLLFVNSLAVKPLGTQYVPILDRALPVPPTAQNQTAVAAHPTGQPATGLTPAQLATWDYGFTYSYPAAAQDDVSITITLNAPTTGGGQTAGPNTSSPLFVALAGFVTNYPAISADLDTYLTQITGQTTDTTIIGNATAAVTALQTLVTGVATTYADQFAPKPKAFGTALDPTTPIAFDATLESQASQDGNALICLRNITIDNVPATYDVNNGTIGNGTLNLPAPVIEILPEQYTATVVATPPSGVTLAYYYPAVNAGSGAPPLAFSGARNEAGRTVSVSGLNVMVYKSARSSMFAERNKILTPDSQVKTVSTNPDFLFQTPVVTFTDPILPRITWPSYALRQVAPVGGSDVVAYMTGFFASLFDGASGTIKLGMGGGYSYSIAPVAGLPRTYVPLNLLQPIPVAITSSPPPAAAIQVTQQVNEWFATVVPTTATGSAMDFSINLFSDLDSEQLLLTINDLYFTTDK